MSMYWLHLETTHFDFDAFGKTKQEAMDMLVAGLEQHGKEYDCAPDWYKEYLEEWVDARAFPFPSCVRDRDQALVP